VNPYYTQPPWEFLLTASRNTLQSYELSRLAHAANLRKELGALLDQYLEENTAAMLARWLMDQRERTVLGEETASAPAPPENKGRRASDNFLGIVSFRRALPVCEPDVSSARRKVSCLLSLLLAAAGITGSLRRGVSTSSRFHHAVTPARFSSRAASLPHVCASLFAKPVSARCKTHLAALRPGTCIYIIRRTYVVHTSAGGSLLCDLRVLCVKAFLFLGTCQKQKRPDFSERFSHSQF